MNVGQIHERLRQELLRRMKRGTVSISLLAHQSGFGASHISSFLRGQRRLSPEGMDRVLAAQRMTVADLLEAETSRAVRGEHWREVPLVEQFTAMHEPVIRPHVVLHRVPLVEGMMQIKPVSGNHPRRHWERLVAVRIAAVEAAPMEPVVLPEGIVVLDRHSVSVMPYRSLRASVYAVRDGSRLKVRYVDYQTQRMVLRPHNRAFPVELVETGPEMPMAEVLIGRVVMVVNSLSS